MTPTMLDIAEEIAPQLIADRRYLHQHPELGYEEHETSQFVAERLRSLGIEVTTGVAKTGVVGLIEGGHPGKTVLLRADMDALPIDEQNDVPYKSTRPGRMHACGHDGHTAMLLGVARILSERRQQLKGTVKLVFQPSEERHPGGALPMIEAGVLENPHIDAAFGMHIGQDLPVGTIGVSDSIGNAAADSFDATITGPGGHAARPHLIVDPVVVACEAVTALQVLVSREVDPLKSAVITVGAINAGATHNVIPASAVLKGTVRTFDPDVQDLLAERVPQVIQGIATTFRTQAEVNYQRGYPPLVNDPEMVELVRAAARSVVGEEKLIVRPPSMGGEDMAYFLQRVPGCFFRVGSKNPEKGLIYGHHHPQFDFDDEVALPNGVATLATVALSYLEQS